MQENKQRFSSLFDGKLSKSEFSTSNQHIRLKNLMNLDMSDLFHLVQNRKKGCFLAHQQHSSELIQAFNEWESQIFIQAHLLYVFYMTAYAKMSLSNVIITLMAQRANIILQKIEPETPFLVIRIQIQFLKGFDFIILKLSEICACGVMYYHYHRFRASIFILCQCQPQCIVQSKMIALTACFNVISCKDFCPKDGSTSNVTVIV